MFRDVVSDFNYVEGNSESNSAERNSDSNSNSNNGNSIQFNSNSNDGNSSSIPIALGLRKASSNPIPELKLELTRKSNSGVELTQTPLDLCMPCLIDSAISVEYVLLCYKYCYPSKLSDNGVMLRIWVHGRFHAFHF